MILSCSRDSALFFKRFFIPRQHCDGHAGFTMIDQIQQLVRFTDKIIAGTYLSIRQEKDAMLGFLFHSLFQNQQQIAQNLVDPLQRTTVAGFRQFIEYYLEKRYRFISPDHLLEGIDPVGKYVLITFDDGYFNNVLARPILEEYGVPAVFFIATDNVRQNKCFWWDVLFRERLAQGATTAEAYREGIALKTLRTHHMEAILKHRFGEDAFQPRSDIDRPFTPTELREFAQSPMVHLGNHTANHAILTNYSRDMIREQIGSAKQWLEQITGKPVLSIAYPNGAFNSNVIEVCKELGLKVGFTVQPTKNALPLRGESAMLQLNRFATHADDSIRSQCRTYRSDALIYSTFREAYLQLAGRRVMR
jgi:peptidoglycan/xylan/chitin deacetylase (PgdA/CDA1 family)